MTMTGIQRLDELFHKRGYRDYRWVNPRQVVVSQWVRMKCMFGCGEYGRSASCPPNLPAVPECERFFQEYSTMVIFRFAKSVDQPQDRHKWSKKVNAGLVSLERDVFLTGYERAFLLAMDSCYLCSECPGERVQCNHPRLSRPSPESMAVDVYSTVKQFDFPIAVRTGYAQEMNRYAFLMIA